MSIEMVKPLEQAYHHMKQALFRPVNGSVWLAVGFTAFLAGLMDHGFGYGWGAPDELFNKREMHWRPEWPGETWRWLQTHPQWLVIIGLIVVFAIVFMVILTWLSSRGVFMFMDNVATKRARVSEPWSEHRDLAHSMFLWRLGFQAVLLALFIGAVALAYFRFRALWEREEWFSGIGWEIIAGALFFVAIALLAAYANLFLTHFIAPIMLKQRVSSTEAWNIFLNVFRRHAWNFILYGILVFLMTGAAIAAIVLAGVMTCCIGLVIFLIPVIGTTITLPVWYTLRAYSLFFLAQFGPEYNIIPASAPETTPSGV